MPWDGFGVFTRSHNWVNDRDASIDITASRMDAECDNFAAGIQACIAKNGENAATANLPMGGFKHTNAGASSARTNYLRVAEFQDGAHDYDATDTGSADAYAIALSPAITTYTAGLTLKFKPANTNVTGAPTIAVNGLAAKTIKSLTGTGLAQGVLAANAIIELFYDGTDFRVLSAPNTTLDKIYHSIRNPQKMQVTGFTGTNYPLTVLRAGSNWVIAGGQSAAASVITSGATYQTLTNRTSPFGTDVPAAGAYDGSSVMVLAGENGKLASSTDSIAWTLRTSTFGTDVINSIAHDGSGLFCAVGGAGKIATSPDGTTWTARTSGTAGLLTKVAHGNGKFMAVDTTNNDIYESSDGITWALSYNAAFNTQSIAYGDGVWVAVGATTHVAISTDNGSSWTAYSGMNLPALMTAMEFNEVLGLFVAGNSGSDILVSADGLVWETYEHKTWQFGATGSYEMIGVDNTTGETWFAAGGTDELYIAR